MSSLRPNIILINADDLGYGDLGCYGSTLNQTPHLNRLAAEGLRLTDFYQASPICSPSRGAMMTGCYPPRIGFHDFGGHSVLFPGQPYGLDPSEITIARLLKNTGYATACVGKWHCGDQPSFLPCQHGFDSYFGLPYSNDMGRQSRANGKVSPYPPLPLMRNGEVIQQQPDQDALTERYVAESQAFIRAQAGHPFFLYLAHFHVHLPHYVSAPFLKQSRNGPYGAAVAAIDWSVGAIRQTLSELGIAENTLILFTSDNGSRARGEGGSNGPLRGHKTQTWEGGMRLPAILHWPAGITAGQVRSDVCSSLDLLPTFCHLAGTHPPTDRVIDGRNIAALLHGEDLPEQPFFYYVQHRLEAVRCGRWKRHVYKGDQPHDALYDLEQDPGETTNVAQHQPQVVAELDSLLAACRRDLGDSVTTTSGNGCRSLGEVNNPQPLTCYDPAHPYIVALYDLPESG